MRVCICVCTHKWAFFGLWRICNWHIVLERYWLDVDTHVYENLTLILCKVKCKVNLEKCCLIIEYCMWWGTVTSCQPHKLTMLLLSSKTQLISWMCLVSACPERLNLEGWQIDTLNRPFIQGVAESGGAGPNVPTPTTDEFAVADPPPVAEFTVTAPLMMGPINPLLSWLGPPGGSLMLLHYNSWGQCMRKWACSAWDPYRGSPCR